MTENSLFYTPELVSHAIGLRVFPDAHAEHESQCVQCGRPIQENEAVSKWSPRDGFTDQPLLAKKDGQYLCLPCRGVNTPELLLYGGRTAAYSGQLYTVNRLKQISWLLHNPPAPPFTIAYRTRKQEHILWRTPVNLNQEVVRVAFGQDIVTVRRAKVMAALKAIPVLNAALESHGVKTTRYGPYVYLSFSRGEPNNGVLRQDILEVARADDTVRAALTPFHNLRSDDLWGLAIMHLDPVEPEILPREKLLANGAFVVNTDNELAYVLTHLPSPKSLYAIAVVDEHQNDLPKSVPVNVTKVEGAIHYHGDHIDLKISAVLKADAHIEKINSLLSKEGIETHRDGPFVLNALPDSPSATSIPVIREEVAVAMERNAKLRRAVRYFDEWKLPDYWGLYLTRLEQTPVQPLEFAIDDGASEDEE